MKKTSLPRVEPGKHAITFGKSPWERQSTPKLYEIVEPPQKHINQIDALLKSSKAMTTKCDASIQSQIEPMDLRQDKRRIWEMVHAAESQMLGELGREEHRSHNAIYKHGELCDAEASLLDIAGDYQNVAETGLEQRTRAKNNSEKVIHMRQIEHGAAKEHFLTIKPPWLTLAETTIAEIKLEGYEHKTKWRQKTDGFLVYMMQHFKREPFGGDTSVMNASIGDHVVVSSSGTATSKALQLLRPSFPGPDDDRMLILEVNPSKYPKALRLCRMRPIANNNSSRNSNTDIDTDNSNSNKNGAISELFVCSDVERPAAAFTRDIVRLRLMLNTLSKRRIVEALESLCSQASDLEAAFNEPYQMSRARVMRATKSLDEDSVAHHRICKAINTEISIAKNMLLRAFVEAQEMLKQYRDEDLHQEHDDVGFLPALGVGSGYGGQSDSNNATPAFAVVPRPSFIYYDLRACCRAGAEREQRVEARNRFHRILLQCSNAGTWQEALHTFGAMLGLGVPPTRETIHHVIRACGRSRPAQPALAVAMTRKMHSMGIASVEKTYLLTMSACSAGGNHRMLAAAFRDLIASGHTPTTSTYDNLLGLCGNGDISADESPELYESLRIAGVPERIAYTAGQMALERGKVTGRLVRSLNHQGAL